MIKNNYKLLGEFWDNLIVSDEILFMDNNDYINDINESINLFDGCGIRKINISTILKMNSLEEVNTSLDKIQMYDSILFNVDYIPINNKIVRNFYKKRINQIYNYYKSKLPNTKFFLSSNYNEI